MKLFRHAPPPSENSSPDHLRRWADQVAKCAISCAKTLEARKIRANEFPLVIGALIKGFCDHTGVPLDSVMEMIRRAAVADQLPENSPADEEVPS